MATPRNTSPQFTSPLVTTATPLRTPRNLQHQQQQQTEEEKIWLNTERALEELKGTELIPLVMDIVEAANSDALRPQDVENAAGPIKVRISRARDILRTMHGLAETPEEREQRVLRLKKNIESKSNILQRFKDTVSQRLPLSKEEGPQQMKTEIPFDIVPPHDAKATYEDVEMKDS